MEIVSNEITELEDILKKQYQLDDDMTFPKASVDSRLIKLQKEVTEFVTSVILKHERELYNWVYRRYPTDVNYLLGTTCASNIQMITLLNNRYYNKIYYDIQHKINSGS